MIYGLPILNGTLIKRYKRFLADIKLDDGQEITAHCPNPGSMRSCSEPGWQVVVSDHGDHSKRKLRYSLELIHNGVCWIGVNPNRANHLAFEAIADKKIHELSDFDEIKKEVNYGQESSRIDLLLTKGEDLTYVEVKSVTLLEDQAYQFPDAVTKRGLKHLKELQHVVASGHRGVMLYVVQRSDASVFKPAAHIDRDYANELKKAHDNGVEVMVWQCAVSPKEIFIDQKVEFEIDWSFI